MFRKNEQNRIRPNQLIKNAAENMNDVVSLSMDLFQKKLKKEV